MKNKVIFFLFIIIILISGFYFFGKPSVTGRLDGFELSENPEFVKLQRVDSLFNKSKKIYILVEAKTENHKELVKDIKDFQKTVNHDLPKVTLISPINLYDKLKLNWKIPVNTVSDFIKRTRRIPILNQMIGQNDNSFILSLTVEKNDSDDAFIIDDLINLKQYKSVKLSTLSESHLKRAVKNQIIYDLRLILGAVISVFLLFTFFAFRSFRAPLFILVIVASSLLSTSIVFSALGLEFNAISMIALPLVLILALSDSLHILTGYANETASDTNRRIENVLSLYFIPSLFSSLTTAFAFFTFYIFSESDNIRELGLITSISLIVEFVITFTIAPLLLFYQSRKKVRDKLMFTISNKLKKYQKAITLSFAAILIASVFIFPLLKFESNPEGYIPNGTQIEETYFKFKQNYFAPFEVNILLNYKDSNELNGNDLNYKRTKELANTIRSMSDVKSVISATDEYTFRTRMGTKANLFSHLGSNNPYYHSASNTYRIEVQLNDINNTEKFRTKINKLKLTSGVRLEFSSRKLMFNSTNEVISSSLLESLITSGIGIFLVLLFLTRSMKIAFLSLFPNLFPIGVVFTIMYLLQMDIFFVTAITMVVGLGLLDDDTVHIIYRRLWLKKPIDELNFSVLSSAFLLSSGFLLFTLSNFQPIRTFGWISALIFMIGVIAELSTMEWIMSIIDRKKNRTNTYPSTFFED